MSYTHHPSSWALILERLPRWTPSYRKEGRAQRPLHPRPSQKSDPHMNLQVTEPRAWAEAQEGNSDYASYWLKVCLYQTFAG
jgi:hypothetical protein